MTSKKKDRPNLILLKHCRLDGDTQPRAEMSTEMIEELARVQDIRLVPPINAVFDGKLYWVWNGHHRTTGLRKGGHKEIWAYVTRGTRIDAVILSLSANADQKALRRTYADKRRAVSMALTNQDLTTRFPTNVAVADVCGVSESFVRKVRGELFPKNTGQTGSSHCATVGPVPERFGRLVNAMTPEQFSRLTPAQKAVVVSEQEERILREDARLDTADWLERVEAWGRKGTELFTSCTSLSTADRKAITQRLGTVLQIARKYE